MNLAGKPERPVHGGLNLAELDALGLRPEEVVDFSASINPLGPPPRALEAARSVNLAAYPDPECHRLRDAIGDALQVQPDCILPGNGSTELIHLLGRAFLAAGDRALIFAPTFGEYEAACRGQGVAPDMFCQVEGATAQDANGDDVFRVDISAALDCISNLRPSITFLCNPNNPTGVYLGEEEIGSIALALQDIGLLVLDEAYLPFVEDRWDSTQLLSLGNVVLLRSMTKDYALTGLRLGYILAREEVIARVRSQQYSWSVNALAQAAGIAALADREHIDRGREEVREGKKYLQDAAHSLGVECPPAAANFLLLRVGDATGLRREMLVRHRVCVRDCTSFGLPEYIRVGVRTMDDNRRLAAALEDVLTSGESVA